MFIVYKTTNKINGKIYIGQHAKDDPKYLGSGLLLNRAIQKYGVDNFIRETLETFQTKLDMDAGEIKWIEKLNSRWPYGYNIAPGGFGGDNLSCNPNKDEIVSRMTSTINERYSKMSIENRKDKYGMNGDKNPMYGKTHSNKTKKFLSEINIGRVPPNKGKTLVEYVGEERAIEIKKLLSDKAKSKVGQLNPFYGKTHSQTTRDVIAEMRRGKYFGNQQKKVSIDGVEYISLNEASRQLDIGAAVILWRIKSKNVKFASYQYVA